MEITYNGYLNNLSRADIFLIASRVARSGRRWGEVRVADRTVSPTPMSDPKSQTTACTWCHQVHLPLCTDYADDPETLRRMVNGPEYRIEATARLFAAPTPAFSNRKGER